jgi:hypothetical protein
MQYMIIERFKDGPHSVYARFREKGRLAPAGLEYLGSVVSEDGTTCWQQMRSENREPLEAWMDAWRDLVEFEVIPTISSAEAASRFGSR